MDIGRYTVLGPLGRGGMGGVYKVGHRELGRIMARSFCSRTNS